MKKLLALTGILFLALALVGCGTFGKEAAVAEEQPLVPVPCGEKILEVKLEDVEAYREACASLVAETEEPAVVKTEEPKVAETEEPVEQPTVKETEVKMIGSISDPDEKTYISALSCSDLPSCTIKEVPQGYFTIGFTNNGDGCDWVLFEEGDTISYDGLDEIHTYNALLPLTRLEGFVASQFQDIFACVNN
jgi:hypothetical protein